MKNKEWLINSKSSSSISSENIHTLPLIFYLLLILSCRRFMESFQIGIKNIPVDQYGSIYSVNRTCITGKFKKFLMRNAVNNLCLLITQILSAQFSKLLRYLLHTCDWFIIFIHDTFLQDKRKHAFRHEKTSFLRT